MGQKVHPYGFRVGYNKDWHSHWFAKHDFAKYLAEDLKLKRDLKKRFGDGVKGLHVYGAKVVRPTALACLIANKS